MRTGKNFSLKEVDIPLIVWYDRTIETSKPNSKGEQNMSEKKETKQEVAEVTNEQILEHLKEIEIAQGCIANGINTLFVIMSKRKEQLKLSSDEVEMIEHGKIAFGCLTDRMADISGMNEKAQKIEVEVHEVSKEEVENFLDFLKEIFE